MSAVSKQNVLINVRSPDFDLAQNETQFVSLSRCAQFRVKGDTTTMRTASTWFLVAWATTCPAWGQAVSTGDEVRKGKHLAVMLCTTCHVVAPDQPYAPTLSPPAPTFQSIAQRAGTNRDSLRNFLTTTHQGLDNPKGMPDPVLANFQIEAITAYLLSLRK